MRKIRVLMIVAQFHPASGGTENQALLLCKSLLDRGIDVSVLTRRRRGLPVREDVGGVPVERAIRVIDRGKLFGITYFLSCLLFLLMRWRRYDIIHCHILHGLHSPAAVVMKLLFGRKVVVKVASTGSLSDFTMMRTLKFGRSMLNFMRHADRIVTLCGMSAAEAREQGFPDSAVVVLPNGVDATRFRPAAGSGRARKRLVYAGSLNPAKGVDILLEAFARARRQNPALDLDIFGSGPMRDSLKAQAGRLGLDGHAVFHGDVPDLERRFDGTAVFVQPSLVEGMSNVILEAMASGLPVVATSTGAAPEIIRHGVNGLLVDPGSVAQMHEAIDRLVSDASLAERMGVEARASIESQYTIERIAGRYHILYQELLGLAGGQTA